MKKRAVGAVVAATGMMIAACSSPSNSSQSQSTTSTSAPSTSTPGARSSTTTAGAAQAVNLPVTDQIRSQLVAAGAALDHIPVAEYRGLAPGLTYYALDKSSHTYWAGARLVPAPSDNPSNPTQAQVASQDEGSYYVFTRPQGGTWTAHAAGNVGPSTPCPVDVPGAVLALWGWPSGSCRPPGQ